MPKIIYFEHVKHAFWTCPGIGIRIYIGWWRMAIVIGISQSLSDFLSRKRIGES